MKLLITALISAGTIYGAAQLADTIVPDASINAAYSQGLSISTAAFIESEFATTSWEEGLRAAVDNARNNGGQLTLDGTTVRWDNGVDVWCIDLPHYNATVEPVLCDAQ